MVLQSIAKALKAQDWISVLIEFLLVVLGVLVALQVDRYNDQLKESANEIQYLSALERDLARDVQDLKLLLETTTDVEGFGRSSLDTLSGNACADKECWRRVVELLHASQWLYGDLNKAAFEEMKRMGLPSDAMLKEQLELYYTAGILVLTQTQELPAYRELVRSIVPYEVQKYVWENCYTFEGRKEIYDTSCDSPISAEAARRIIESLKQRQGIREALTFWLSRLSLATLALPQQKLEAERLLAAVRSATAV